MARILRASLLLIVFWCLSLPASAIDKAPAPLPAEMDVRVSIRSFDQLIERLGNAVSIAGADTDYAMFGDMLPMLVDSQSPLPPDGWNREGGVEVLVNTRTGDFVCILSADSFDGFLVALEEAGVDKELDEESKFYKVNLPNIGHHMVGDGGNGRVIIAAEAGLVQQAKDWTSDFWGSGEVTVDFRLPADWSDEMFEDALAFIKELPESLKNDDSEMVSDIKAFGLNHEVIRGLSLALAKRMPALLDGIGKVTGFSFDLRLHDGFLGLDTRLHYAEPHVFSTMAKAANARDNLDLTASRFVKPSAYSFAVSAPVEEILPGADEILHTLFDAIGVEAFPEMREDLITLWDEFQACRPGQAVMARHFRDGDDVGITWNKADDAEKLLGVYIKGVEVVNRMLAKAIVSPDLKCKLEYQAGKTGTDVKFYSIAFIPDNPEEFSRTIAMLSGNGASAHTDVERLFSMRLLCGVKDGMVVVVTGNVSGDDYQDTVTAMDNDSKDGAFIDLPEADKAVSALANRQNMVSLVRMDDLFVILARKVLQAFVPASDKGASERALDRLLEAADLTQSGGIAGIAFGAAGDLPSFDVAIPLAAINSYIRNYESISRLLQENNDNGNKGE